MARTQIKQTGLEPSIVTSIVEGGGPKITAIQITNNTYTLLDDTAVSLDGGFVRITGTGFSSGCQVLINNTPATSVAFVSSTQVHAQVPANAAGTYIVYLVNTNGGVAIAVNGLTYSATPTWVTGSSLSGTVSIPISIQLSATAATAYSLAAGSTLPAGLTLTSGGLLSGTVTGITLETVYNFTVNAVDAELQDSPRSFSITITVGDAQFMFVTALLNPELSVLPFNDDASTNNFAVTVVGDTRPNGFGPYTPGYYSNFFDGNGDYLTVPSNSNWSFAGQFTIEGWFYWNVSPAAGSIIGAQTNGSLDLYNTGTALSPNVFGSGNVFNSTFFPLVGVWYHIAITRNSSNLMTMWVNGVSVGSATTSASYTAGTYIIGSFANTNALQGYISNFRIVNGTAVYTAAFTPATAPLTAIAGTSLLTCQSNRFIDNSTNNFAITRNGDARIDGFDPFVPATEFLGRGSTFFDGTGDFLTAQSMTLGTSPFTIEFWAYPTSIPANAIIFSTASNGGIQLQTDSSGNMAVGTYGVANTIATSGSPFVANRWLHIVVVRSGTGANQTSIFFNGVRNVNGTVNTNYVAGPATIGGASSQMFFGYISNFRVVIGTAVYDPTQTTLTVPTEPLTAVANTSLLTCQTNQPANNSAFIDNSTNNLLITRNGNTTQGSFSPYGGGWSNFLAGSGSFLEVGSTAYNMTGNWTMECWFYATTTGILFDCRPDGVNGQYVLISITSDTGLALTANATDFPITVANSLNRWNHVAVVRNSSTITIYYNGTSVFTVATSGTWIVPANRPRIGANGGFFSAAPGVLTGHISNLRIVNGTAVYTANFTPSTTPLTAIAGTSLLTCCDNRFIDDSPNNFAITRTGDVRVQKFNPFGIQTAMTPLSHSVFFDGNADLLTLPSSSAFNISGNFTIEGWYNFTALPPSGQNDNLWTFSGTTTFNPYLYLWGDGTLILRTAQTSGTVFTFTHNFAVGVWYHIALVKSGTTFTLYINGVSSATGTSSAIVNENKSLIIGESSTFGLHGYLSNFRVVNGTALYTANFTPSTTPLTAIANTSLLTCQNSTIVDNSTNRFAIAVTADARPTQINPFGFTAGIRTSYTPAVFGGSMTFDGTGDNLATQNLVVLTPSANFTAECWVYNLGFGGTQWGRGIFALVDSSNNDRILVRLNASFNLVNLYGVVGASILFGTSGTDSSLLVTPNSWTHLALVKQGSSFVVYLNGVAAITATSAANLGNIRRVLVATSPDGAVPDFNGSISDFRFVNGTALYTSNFVPPVAPLTPVSNTTMLLNGTGAAIYDASTVNNLETVGDARNATNITRYGNTSMFFGTGGGAYAQTPIDQANFGFGTGNFTIEMWINPTPGNSGVFFDTRRQTENRINMSMNTNNAGISVSVGTTAIITVTTGITPGSWNYIAVTGASGSLRMFINGTQVGSTTTMTTDLGAVGSLCLGCAGDARGDNRYGYTGYISDLRITRGVARYIANFTPPAVAFPTQ